MRRVAVIGCGGAGKSTLARELGRRLQLLVLHLDEHYWRPGWRPKEPGAWRELQQTLVAGDAWVIDGNYLSTLGPRLTSADTVVFLDLPRWRCIWRVTRRLVAGRGRANTADGCPERLGRRHLRFVNYIWRFRRDSRPRVMTALAACEPATTIFRLTSAREVRLFLRGLAAEQAPRA